MKVMEMYDKVKNPKGNLKPRNLDEVVAGSSGDDFIQDGDLVKIIDKSTEGFYNETFGKNAVFVIMERAKLEADGKTITDLGEAVQVNLSAFDRSVAPWKKMADGTLQRDGETVRADGDVVTSWKASKSAKAFMTTHMDKYMKFTLKQEVETRAWDRNVGDWSETETRKQKVYTITWA